MKIGFLFLLILFIVVPLSYIIADEKDDTATKGAIIEFQEESHDFGDVQEGIKVSYIFKFANIGDDTLRIRRVSGGWGCTGALLSSEVIAPGDSGEIQVTFNSKRRQGKVRKLVRVYSNDTENAARILTITANVFREEESSWKVEAR